MKKKLITSLKIVIGVLSIAIPFRLIVYLFGKIIPIYNYDQLKWVALLICFLGFYISGLINRKTSIKLIPILYLSLLLFIPLRCFYFPLVLFLLLFATVSLLLTRRELGVKIKRLSGGALFIVFIYFLFSQPLIVKSEKHIELNQYGEIKNGKVIWNFSGEKRIYYLNLCIWT